MTVDYKNDINKMQKIFKVINGKENFELIKKKNKIAKLQTSLSHRI